MRAVIELFTGKPFSLNTTDNMLDVIERLNNVHWREKQTRYHRAIYVEHTNDWSYSFHSGKGFNEPYITGQIVQQKHHTTVSGYVQLHIFIRLGILMYVMGWIGLAIPIWDASLVEMKILHIGMIFAMLLTIIRTNRQQNVIIKLITEALE